MLTRLRVGRGGVEVEPSLEIGLSGADRLAELDIQVCRAVRIARAEKEAGGNVVPARCERQLPASMKVSRAFVAVDSAQELTVLLEERGRRDKVTCCCGSFGFRDRIAFTEEGNLHRQCRRRRRPCSKISF